LKEVLIAFLKENHRPGEKFHADILNDQFLELEFKAFNLLTEKINMISSIYKDYVLRIMDFKTESIKICFDLRKINIFK
jgi:hypothetical protein